MKNLFTILLVLAVAICSCSKKEDAATNTGTAVVPKPDKYFTCKINGISFSNKNTDIDHLWWSHQTSGIQALTLTAKGDTLQLSLYVQMAMYDTGTYPIPSKSKVLLSINGGQYFPSYQDGSIRITEYSNKKIKGTFNTTHIYSSDTLRMTEGDFQMTLP